MTNSLNQLLQEANPDPVGVLKMFFPGLFPVPLSVADTHMTKAAPLLP